MTCSQGRDRGVSPLFVERRPADPYSRAELVELSRRGHRGLRISPPVTVSTEDARLGVSVLQLVRDAVGTSLRVYWEGRVVDIDPALLEHLDPPWDAAGQPQWEVPRFPYLTVRHGPGFLIVEDRRLPPPGREVVDDLALVSTLTKCGTARTADELASRREQRALDELRQRGWVCSLGPYFLSLPVRFRHSVADRGGEGTLA